MNTFHRYVNGQLVERSGDKLEAIAQPIARAVDKTFGTKIASCGGCKKMKERLNAGMPFAQALKLRIKGE
jgi:hypothetical protein